VLGRQHLVARNLEDYQELAVAIAKDWLRVNGNLHRGWQEGREPTQEGAAEEGAAKQGGSAMRVEGQCLCVCLCA